MADTGEVAPARTLAAERAMAAVAVMPPKNGAIILPAPWPISSVLELCFLPVMPSNTTAHSRDSMAPSMAMENAAGSRAEIVCQLSAIGLPSPAGRSHGSINCGKMGGMPWPCVPSASR
ncbi:hypothetical protein D3C81_1098150 [compost metagenome]